MIGKYIFSSNTFFYLFLGIWLLLVTQTLSIFPLPWFDEVYLLSVSKNLLVKGNFIPEIASYARYNKEALSYGPVYFVLQAIVIHLFGTGIIAARSIAFVGGLGLAIALFFILKKNRWLLLLFLVNPLFNLCLHEGRPDILASFFGVCALCFAQRKHAISVVGLLSISAVLTHPRAVVLIIGVLFFVYKNYVRNEVIFFLLVLFLGYSTWVIIGYGGGTAWVNYYIHALKGNNTAPYGFLGFNTYYIHSLIPFYVTVMGALIYEYSSRREIPVNAGMMIFIVALFLIFFKDYGTYAIMVLPIMMLLLNDLESKNRFLIRSVTILYLFYWFLKMIFVLSATTQHMAIGKFVKFHIPKTSKVIGEAKFYYACEENQIKFQLIDKYNTPMERACLLTNEYDYDYMIISSDKRKNHTDIAPYFSKNDHVKVALFNEPEHHLMHRFLARFKIFSLSEEKGFQSVLYRRIRN